MLIVYQNWQNWNKFESIDYPLTQKPWWNFSSISKILPQTKVLFYNEFLAPVMLIFYIYSTGYTSIRTNKTILSFPEKKPMVLLQHEMTVFLLKPIGCNYSEWVAYISPAFVWKIFDPMNSKIWIPCRTYLSLAFIFFLIS